MAEFLDSFSRKSTRRMYERGIELFCEWYGKDVETILKDRKDDLTPRANESLFDAKQRASRYEKLLEKFHAWLLEQGYKLNSARTLCLGLMQLLQYYNMKITLRTGSPVSKTVVTTNDFILQQEHVRAMFHVAKDLRSKLSVSMGNDLGWRTSNTRRLRTIIRSLFYALITTRISVKFATVILRRETNKCNRIGDCVDLAFNVFNVFPFRLLSIRPAQVEEEITELLRLFAKHKPKFLLEIGTAKGGTLFLLARVSRPDAVIISIDLPGGRFGGGYPEWRKMFYKSFAIHRQRHHLIREDSHALATLNMVKKILQRHKLDFLFIDGDHTYNGVKKDFKMYSGLVQKGGIIAFHDIVPGPPENVGGVPRFWNEIKHNLSHIELVRDWKQEGCGIGLVFV